MNDKQFDAKIDAIEVAERSVLTAVLSSPRSLAEVSRWLGPSHFRFPKYRATYQAMLAIARDLPDFDCEQLCAFVERTGMAQACGGVVALIDLDGQAFTAANIQHHARIVHAEGIRRKRMTLACELRDELAHGPMTEERWATLLGQLVASRSSFDDRRTVWGREGARRHFKILEKRFEAGGRNDWVTTGFRSLDEKIGGLEGGTITVLAGRPGMGKSAVAGMIAQNMALRGGKRTLMFSQEMSFAQVYDRLIASEAQVRASEVRKGRFGKPSSWSSVVSAYERVSDCYGLFVGQVSLAELRSECMRAKADGGLDLVVVDYLQIMHGNRSRSRNEEITEIINGLKAASVEMDVPVIVLSQVNRDCESRTDKRPLMSDLRDSGSIEQAADFILMCYRDGYYNKYSDEADVVEISITKARNGGAGDVVKLRWIPDYVTITDYN